jgi:hypothetical protein
MAFTALAAEINLRLGGPGILCLHEEVGFSFIDGDFDDLGLFDEWKRAKISFRFFHQASTDVVAGAHQQLPADDRRARPDMKRVRPRVRPTVFARYVGVENVFYFDINRADLGRMGSFIPFARSGWKGQLKKQEGDWES